MAQVKAQLNSLRMSPRKVRAVVNLVKGKDALRAIEQLEFAIKRASGPLIKLIHSALANAENNFGMVKENLFIKEFYVDEGMKLKRYRPKAFGRAGEIQKKTSHVKLVLEERVAGLKAKNQPKETEHTHDHNHDDHDHDHEHNHEHQAKPKTDRPEIKTELGKKGTGVKKKFFQRKVV
ncbi:50S ribosomal protein L22 [Candidatus Parcubacteria bacterium]|nr:50S ribosomal protein L22 [Candidatus Parcubacteria bacterium]